MDSWIHGAHNENAKISGVQDSRPSGLQALMPSRPRCFFFIFPFQIGIQRFMGSYHESARDSGVQDFRHSCLHGLGGGRGPDPAEAVKA